MNARKLKRTMKKAQGIPLRRGPEKGTTGAEKGIARTPSREEVRQSMRRASKAEKERLAAEAAKQQAETPDTKAA